MHCSFVSFISMLWQSPIVNISDPRMLRGPREGQRYSSKSVSSSQETGSHQYDRCEEIEMLSNDRLSLDMLEFGLPGRRM